VVSPQPASVSREDVARILQIALLDEVFPALRAVAFEMSTQRVQLHFIVDDALSPMDTESVSCIETEVIALLPADVRVDVAVVIEREAKPPGAYGRVVFSRRARQHPSE
jgi:hypothetical protein